MPEDPFDLLGLPARFDVDPGELQRAYLARSARLHPDHAAGDPGAEAASASLNAAKLALGDPERRAEALLRRLGGPSSSQDRTLPAEFLAEMLTVREQIEEASASGDRARIEGWQDWAEAQRNGHIRRVADLFRSMGQTPGRDELRSVRAELNMWRYIERLIEQLDPDAGQGGLE